MHIFLIFISFSTYWAGNGLQLKSQSPQIITTDYKLCGSRYNMPHPSPSSVGAEAPRAAEPTAPDRNVAVGSHGEYVTTSTAAAA